MGTLRISLYEPPPFVAPDKYHGAYDRRAKHLRFCDACSREAKYRADAAEFKAAARRKNPYPWRLWNDPRGPAGPQKVAMHSLKTPAWAHAGPAYLNGRPWAASDAANLVRYIDEWARGAHPWAPGRSMPPAKEYANG